MSNEACSTSTTYFDISVPAPSHHPLFDAIIAGDLEGVRGFFSDPNQDPEQLLRETTRTGSSPIHVAAFSESPDIVQFLLERGALVDTTDDDLCTPLHFACSEGSIESAIVLLDAGANINATTEDAMVRVSSIPIYIPGGRTPLHFAADRGQLDIARELLARGAQVASDFDGNLPIDLALLRKDAPLVQLFDVERQLLTSAEVAAKLRSDHLHRQHRIEQKQKEKRRAKMMATFTTSAEASSS